MSEGAVVQRYARALFEIGLETGQLGSLTEQIRAVADLWQGSRELRTALDDPSLDEGRRQSLIGELAARLGISGPALGALRIMATRQRLAALPGVARELTRLGDEHQGLVRVSVRSAAFLPDSYYENLVQKLEATTGKRVVLEKYEDPTLIGGVVLSIGDSIIDGSIRGRLQQLERRLLAGAAAAQA